MHDKTKKVNVKVVSRALFVLAIISFVWLVIFGFSSNKKDTTSIHIMSEPFKNILADIVNNDESLYSDDFQDAYYHLQNSKKKPLHTLSLSEKDVFILKKKAPAYAKEYPLCNDFLYHIITEQTLLSTIPYAQCLSNYATIQIMQR